MNRGVGRPSRAAIMTTTNVKRMWIIEHEEKIIRLLLSKIYNKRLAAREWQADKYINRPLPSPLRSDNMLTFNLYKTISFHGQDKYTALRWTDSVSKKGGDVFDLYIEIFKMQHMNFKEIINHIYEETAHWRKTDLTQAQTKDESVEQ